MKRKRRKNGISVLIACQNEEAVLGLCIYSFLAFGDELIIVDNGSVDNSKAIAQRYANEYPSKVQFFDVPHLTDLYQNRQFAFERSNYRWVVRADADYVLYTNGKFDARLLRNRILALPKSPLPRTFALRQANLTADFWHTGLERNGFRPGPEDPGRFVPPPVSPSMVRIYEVFPGFRFERRGRGEGVRFNRLLQLTCKRLRDPIWIHCNIKSEMNYFFRSERTNWRELGDFDRYPTLEKYIESVVLEKYGTTDLITAATLYMSKSILPYLQHYNPKKYYPYPSIVEEQMEKNPVYRVSWIGKDCKREF